MSDSFSLHQTFALPPLALTNASGLLTEIFLVLEPALALPPLVLSDLNGRLSVTLDNASLSPVSLALVTALQGPQGLRGEPGAPGAALDYVFTQGTPSAQWIITHQMGAFPSVVVVDSSGRVVEGDVTYDSATQITLSFSAAFSGTARII